MKKNKVINYIDLYLQNLIKELKNELKDKVKASVIQCSDINDMDSHSHQFQALEEEQKIIDRLDHVIKEQLHFQKISTIKADKVGEGALVETKIFYILIGIVTPVISNIEKDIIGITTAAPIYKTFINQEVGFPFQFNGTECVILSIQ